MFEDYILATYKQEIIKILEDPDKDKHFCLYINFSNLHESEPQFVDTFFKDSEPTLKKWDEAIFNVQQSLLKENKLYILKTNVHCRIHTLPTWPHVVRNTFPGNDDANQFVQINGTVTRISARKLLEYQRQYVCVKCKYPIMVEAIYDKRYMIKQPKRCSNPNGCNGKNLITFDKIDVYNCKDYQEIKVQEDLSKSEGGSVPNHMIVTLEDDLVNVCKPGENITITGTVVKRWGEFDKGAKIVIDIVLKANHITINNSKSLCSTVSDGKLQFFNEFWSKYKMDPLEGRNVILKSISPEMYGLHIVKLAIAIILAGGSQSLEEAQQLTGVNTRCGSHLLLVGDPGTGKSQMLRFASRIMPRSVLTTGIGSTAAGLTVTAAMENGEWQLEAGALVMADGGICCIDEFNSMKEHDRTSIHEAMEQQTISVAKAGIVCKLKTRCSILAACNPKGNIDMSQPLCVNVAMSSPLLSRFDLILLLRDVVDEGSDRRLAEHLLNKGTQARDEEIWNLETLQAYYAFIRKESPKLCNDAETILSIYYQLQRKFSNRNKSRTTVRLLESLIRLSQGHAKLMCHHEVQVMDAIFSVTLIDSAMDVESSLLNLKVDNNSFLDEPEQKYLELSENILGKLNLDYIYQREIKKKGLGGQTNEDNALVSQQVPLTQGLFTQRNVNIRHSTQNVPAEETLIHKMVDVTVPKPKQYGFFSQSKARQKIQNEIFSQNMCESFTQIGIPGKRINDSGNFSASYILDDSRVSVVHSDGLKTAHDKSISKATSLADIVRKKRETNIDEIDANLIGPLKLNVCQNRAQRPVSPAGPSLPLPKTKPKTNSLLEVVRSKSNLDFDDDIDFNENAEVPAVIPEITTLQADQTNHPFNERPSKSQGRSQSLKEIVSQKRQIEFDDDFSWLNQGPPTKVDTTSVRNQFKQNSKTLTDIVRQKSKEDYDNDLEIDWNLPSTSTKNIKHTDRYFKNATVSDLALAPRPAKISKKPFMPKPRKNQPIREFDLINLIPSVNEDFEMNIDWDMDGETENTEPDSAMQYRTTEILDKHKDTEVVTNITKPQERKLGHLFAQFEFHPKDASNPPIDSTGQMESKRDGVIEKPKTKFKFKKRTENTDLP